jgi:hypothetical protein
MVTAYGFPVPVVQPVAGMKAVLYFYLKKMSLF